MKICCYNTDFYTEYMKQIGNAIKQKVDAAYKSSSQSKQLLEIAKTGVEKAIEENEEESTAWIDRQLEILGVELS